MDIKIKIGITLYYNLELQYQHFFFFVIDCLIAF